MSNSWAAPLLALLVLLSTCRLVPLPLQAADKLLLRPGEKVVLRVRQVIPGDGLSRGERLLNSRPLLTAGDRFLAEVLNDSSPSGVLIGGTIARVHPPGWFHRPGHVELQLVQLVECREGSAALCPLRVDLRDRRLGAQAGRFLTNFYFGFEGGDVGAAVGAQLAQGNLGFIMGGAGIGFLVGLGGAALVHGSEARLEPGDTFEITIGSCSYRSLPQKTPLTVYPPSAPAHK